MNRFYSDTGPERCGLILKSGMVLEVDNIAEDKENTFGISATVLLEYEDEITHAWHTHPGRSSNLSGEDYQCFQDFPEYKHLVIGKDGVTCYSTLPSGSVVRDDSQDCTSWFFKEEVCGRD